VKAATGAEAVNVVSNNGPDAGQTIFHIHWHVIPRFAGDAVRWPWPHSPYGEGGLDAMKARIIASL
jgi:histidine triad (HIT) family protein